MSSADVLLDDLRRAQVRVGRVVPGLARGAALAQQVPALIELHLQLLQVLLLAVGELVLLEQPVLLGDELLDMAQRGSFLPGGVFHGGSWLGGGGSRMRPSNRRGIPSPHRSALRPGLGIGMASARRWASVGVTCPSCWYCWASPNSPRDM